MNWNEGYRGKLRMFVESWFPKLGPELITAPEKEEEEYQGFIDHKSK
jgi:hypothetical protein